MYTFNKHVHEFLLESTLALSLASTTCSDSVTKPSLFHKQQGSWGWGTDTLGSLTSQQATGPSHISKGNFPVFRDGYPALDTQIMLFFYQTEGNL